MLTIQNLSYTHLNKDLLFENIDLTVNQGEKVGLIGNNGTGKSTLLSIIMGALSPSVGNLSIDVDPYCIPQLFGQYNHLTIAEALGVSSKIAALHEILSGVVTSENYEQLNDDWGIEERCKEALHIWGLADLGLVDKMDTLSGGQKTRVFLAGTYIHQPEFIVLDEPTNHLDNAGRAQLYDFIQNTKSTMLIVSHDRTLLNHLSIICELSKHGISVYGGNYDFYKAQKMIELNALNLDVQSKEKALKIAKEKSKETIERQQKLDVRAKKNVGKAGLPKIVANTWKNSAERSTAKITGVHADRTTSIQQELRELRSSLSANDQMKLGFDNATVNKGKMFCITDNINFAYDNEKYLWKDNLSFQLARGERMAIKGANGSGKTTLINVILGNLVPQTGMVSVAENKSVYIDQDYSLIDKELTIYEQAQQYNITGLQEHEVKIRLNRFLFFKDDWDKPCLALSGGERMRLMLCCLNIGVNMPDIIILDEPTNNLDLQNIETLTNAIDGYQGTLVVVSHDDVFLNQVRISKTISL